MSKYVYKYPGTDIEYLDGKTYDYKIIGDHELEDHLSEGWSETPEQAELFAEKTVKAKK